MVVSNVFYFHPYLGKIPILTNIFQMGWNHQPVMLVSGGGFCSLSLPTSEVAARKVWYHSNRACHRFSTWDPKKTGFLGWNKNPGCRKNPEKTCEIFRKSNITWDGLERFTMNVDYSSYLKRRISIAMLLECFFWLNSMRNLVRWYYQPF